jgi:recombinational DNA repair protein RecR
MVLGVIITVGIAVVVVLVIIKLLRDPNIGKNTNKTKQCIACGNKTNSLICEFCKKNAKSLR